MNETIDWQRAFYEAFDELLCHGDYQSNDFSEPNAKAAVVHYWDNYDPTPTDGSAIGCDATYYPSKAEIERNL